MLTLASPASPSAAGSVAIAVAMIVAVTTSPSEISTGSSVSPVCLRALRPDRAGPPDSMSFICGSQVAVSRATTGGRVLVCTPVQRGQL